MSAQHVSGGLCDNCEGHCLRPVAGHFDAGLEMSVRIGQHVRHRDYQGKRVTGVVRGISLDGDGRLEAHIVLDAPIVIPKHAGIDREISIWHQHVPIIELAPFDERDEQIAELASALGELLYVLEPPEEHDGELYRAADAKARAALAKVNRSAA